MRCPDATNRNFVVVVRSVWIVVEYKGIHMIFFTRSSVIIFYYLINRLRGYIQLG